ncbi:MAG: ribonucleotide reductase [Pseudomonadales bacterium RIFCSPLOWO2_02_FULL_63_210]|nr:MAG: ribonucleotide reductase [Pseudomonadales bacterium RIFCSPLOWO2_02_FULL_63_210]
MRRLNPLIFTVLVAFTAPTFADGVVRDILSSGATTASTYLTFKDDKLIVPARDDASSYVASGGEIRGPYLEAALNRLRAEHPELQASDMELASAILAAKQH